MNDAIFSSDISVPEISLGKDDKNFNFFMFIVFIIIFAIIVIPWDKLNLNRENMSGGTLAQLYAQDSQDVYLKGNVDKLATSNFNLFWNQPTRQANTFMNRGTPLNSIVLPNTSMNPTKNLIEVSNNYKNNIIDNNEDPIEKTMKFKNPIMSLNNVLPENNKIKQEIKSIYNSNKSNNHKKILNNSVPTLPKNSLPSSLPLNTVANSNPYELASVGKFVAKTKQTSDNLPKLTREWSPSDYLYQAYYNNGINDTDCINDPPSCGNYSGSNNRLNSGFVQPTKAKSSVDIDSNTFYPDSYVGSYWIEPSFDISKPLPFLPESNKV